MEEIPVRIRAIVLASRKLGAFCFYQLSRNSIAELKNSTTKSAISLAC